MGRKPEKRINGDRLKKAIKLRGMTPVTFGMRLYMTRNRKTASTNIYRLCLPEGHKLKTGLNPGMLSDAAKMLDVNEEWLLGEPVAMNEAEWLQAVEARKRELDEMAEMYCSKTLLPLLEEAGYTFTRNGFAEALAAPVSEFQHRSGKKIIIPSYDLHKMESMCVDLIDSMIRHRTGDMAEFNE